MQSWLESPKPRGNRGLIAVDPQVLWMRSKFFSLRLSAYLAALASDSTALLKETDRKLLPSRPVTCLANLTRLERTGRSPPVPGRSQAATTSASARCCSERRVVVPPSVSRRPVDRGAVLGSIISAPFGPCLNIPSKEAQSTMLFSSHLISYTLCSSSPNLA